MYPLLFATDECFERVRAFLTASGYTEEFLLKHFEVPSLHDLLYAYGDRRREKLHRLSQGPGAALFLARLLLRGYTVGKQECLREAGALMADFEALGLIEPQPGDAVRCPVVVYPALNLFVAADRPLYPDGSRGYMGSDYVLSGTEAICRRYVASLPPTRCRRFLDMGAGTGLAAMANAKLADEVWAVDVSARAVHFAEFNRRLNGIENMRVLQGDLFEPVGDVTFDRIAANPPFEPPLKRNYVFSIGGEDGEQIMRRLVTGAQDHLEPGGRLYCQVSGTDRVGELFDMRIRSWLGERHEEFDLLIFLRDRMTPREYAVEQVLADNTDSWALDEWAEFYRRLQAIRVVIGHLIIQRHEIERAGFHWRNNLHPSAGMREMEWLMDWEMQRFQPGFATMLMDSKLQVNTDWRLTTVHGMPEGNLAVCEGTLRNAIPYETEIEFHPAAVEFLLLCDGSRTARQAREQMRGRGLEPDDRTDVDFVEMLSELIAARFVRIVG